eukprot:6407418-Amphidinium_carterae.4
MADPPKPMWGNSCPTAWSKADAKRNAVAFDVSTDIQSVNMFLEEYCSASVKAAGNAGLRGIFRNIADSSYSTEVTKLLADLEGATGKLSIQIRDFPSFYKTSLRERAGLRQ